jgi:uncharacterized repeat protein (TIGR01451 family)
VACALFFAVVASASTSGGDGVPASLTRDDWRQIRRAFEGSGLHVHEAQLFGPPDAEGLATGFGGAVSVEQDTVAIGAFWDDGINPRAGAAYVFVRTATTWTLQQGLWAADGVADDRFGWSISLSGDTVVVGAPMADVAGQTDAGAAYVFVRSGTTWTEQQKLVASDGATLDQFGWKVAASGDTVAVGAPLDDVAGQNGVGSAYVFARSGTVWTEQQHLLASDGQTDDTFGESVALGGDTAVVGARNADGVTINSGAAYVFVRAGTAWTEQQKLAASDGAAGDAFGDASSISGDTVVVGAPFDTVGPSSFAGSAYVFVRSGTTWTEQQQLAASDGSISDAFGWSVSVSGDTVVAGAPFDGNNGSAYLFVRSGTTWTEQQKVVPSAPTGIDFFGLSVSLSGDTAVVGASAGGAGVGSAYVFVRSGATWPAQQRIAAPDPQAVDRFGQSVSVSGDTVVVGAPADNTPFGVAAGSASVFVRSGAVWILQQRLLPSVGAADDSFGGSVSVDGDTLVVGAPGRDVPITNGGAVFVFVRSGTTWSEQQQIVAAGGGVGDAFGASVAVSGDTALVGVPYDNTPAGVDAGSASVFVRSGTTWTPQQQMLASDAAAGDYFGYAVSVAGDTAVVGAPLNAVPAGPFAGAAYAFVRSGTTWSEQQRLLASDGGPSDVFGAAVSVSGDTAVIGAYGDDGAGPDEGSAYVFERAGAAWSEQQKLVASDAAAGDQLGYSVSVSGDTTIVGAQKDDTAGGGDAGAAYLFVRAGTAWSEQQKLMAPDGAAGDGFGLAVSVSGDVAAAGAPTDDTSGGPDAGSAHVFRRTPFTDLGVTKTDGQATVTPGETITYTITASNAGPEAAAGATVTDVLPAALLGAAWTCTATAGSSCAAGGAGNVNDIVGLLPGGTATYVLTATVDPAATGTLANTVAVAPPAGGTDPNPADNSATDTDALAPEADLAVTKTDSPDPVQPGGALAYTLTIANAGPSNATGVTAVDSLPAGVTFVSSIPGAPTCVLSGATLTCNLGALAAAGSSTVTIDTTVNATGGILVNSASVSASEPDPYSGNNAAIAGTAVGRRTAELAHGTDQVYDLAAQPGPVADEDVFRMSQKPYSSYEIVIDATSGDIGAGAGPLLERIGADGTSVLQGSAPAGAGPSRSLRWANTTASEVEGEAIRVRSAGCGTDCGPDDVYRIRVYETTYAVPRVNNSGTQITVLVLQDPTNYPINGEAYVRNTSGVLVATQPFSLGPKATLVLDTSTIPGAAGVSGTITVAHDGRYGDLAGKAVALEPATGFSFDSALEPRPK